MYTSKVCLVTVFDADDLSNYCYYEEFSASLFLFAWSDFSSKDSLKLLFDASDSVQPLPISRSDQGRILWSRNIRSDVITKIYSEKLTVVQNIGIFDVLDARNESLLCSIAFPFYKRFIPFIGPLCSMIDGEKGQSWFVDMRTGCTYNPPVCLTTHQTGGYNKTQSLGVVRTTHLPPPGQYMKGKLSSYLVSSPFIGRIDASSNGIY
ncbi:hypothetical protein BDF19DRAFT_482644 [Syncephalis fuscata]|nr:hypothetical protein BDF19DRAFT_482644 [Syncephalis fuscata]